MDPDTHSEEPSSDWDTNWHGRGSVLFLLDAASPLEARILRAWIAEQRPPSLEPADIGTVPVPSSRRPGRARTRSALAALEPELATDGDPTLVPLRVAWLPPERAGRRAASLWDVVLRLGDPRDPGRLRARWVRRFSPDRCRIVVGEAAPASELRKRWRAAAGTNVAETVGLALFVARQAALALDRSERRLRGSRYKIPRFLKDEVLARPSFVGGLERLARDQGRSAKTVRRQAQRCLREIAANHSPLMIDAFAQLCRSSSTRGYGALRVDPAQIEQLRSLAQRHPIVFLPTHKSNLDHPVLFRALHEAGMPPSHTAGGDNMNFFPAGPVARRAGIFFIRRSFKDDEVYKFVLRSYIDFLIEKRFPLEWFIEGGRSRSGKLLPPRYGLLSYVVDSYQRGKSDDVILVPVSIAYDQISEVGEYAAEQRGAPKQREGALWLFRFLRRLGRRYGNIDLRFGDPLSLREALGPPPASGREAADDAWLVPKLAFEVCSRINRATPITPVSLAMLAVLGAGDRAMSLREIHRALTDLAHWATNRGLPTSEKLHFESPDDVRATLGLLVENGVLVCFDEGPEHIYSVAPDQHLSAAYYRNTVIHFLTTGAITELALLRAAESGEGDSSAAFWDEATRLRDLFKFEFFFPAKKRFREEVREELSFQARDWEKRIENPDDARELLQRIRPFHAHRTLRAFLDAYAVVADRLVVLEDRPAGDETKLVSDCMALGKQYALQRRIRSAESLSRILLNSGVRLAANRNLLEGDPAAQGTTLAADRARFADELHETIRRVEAIDALASARRAGALF